MLGKESQDRKSIARKVRQIPVENAKAFECIIEEVIVVSRLLELTYRIALNTKSLPDELKALINRANLIVVNADKLLSSKIRYKSRPPVVPQLTDHAIAKLTAVIMLEGINNMDIVTDLIDPKTRIKLLNEIRQMSNEQYEEWLTANKD